MIYEITTLFNDWVCIDLSKCILVKTYDDPDYEVRGIQIDSFKIPLYSYSSFRQYPHEISWMEYRSILSDIKGITKYRGYEKYKEAQLKIAKEKRLFYLLLKRETNHFSKGVSYRTWLRCSIMDKCCTIEEFLLYPNSEWKSIFSKGTKSLCFINKFHKYLSNIYGKEQKQKTKYSK